MSSKVYIVILNYNGWQDTIECLESVLKSDYKNYQIIVVDNDSPDDSMEYLIKWAEGKLDLWLPDSNPLKCLSFPLREKPLDYVLYNKKEALEGGDREKERKLKNHIVFIHAGENRGFSAGNNVGIKYALAKNDFEYIWLLNNDTVIEKNTLKNLVNYANQNKTGISGSVLKYYNEPDKIQAYGGKINRFLGTGRHIIRKDEVKTIDYVVGASMLIHRNVIEKAGLLPEDYFLYYEDVDYCFNAKRNGFKLGTALYNPVYHKEGSSTKKHSEFVDCLYLKNKIKFHKKYINNSLGLIITVIISLAKRLKNFKKSIQCIKGV